MGTKHGRAAKGTRAKLNEETAGKPLPHLGDTNLERIRQMLEADQARIDLVARLRSFGGIFGDCAAVVDCLFDLSSQVQTTGDVVMSLVRKLADIGERQHELKQRLEKARWHRTGTRTNNKKGNA